jgi:hypothetical protein
MSAQRGSEKNLTDLMALTQARLHQKKGSLFVIVTTAVSGIPNCFDTCHSIPTTRRICLKPSVAIGPIVAIRTIATRASHWVTWLQSSERRMRPTPDI